MTVFTARQLQVDERGALVLATLAGVIVGLFPKSVSAAIAYQLALASRAGEAGIRRWALTHDAWAVAAALTLVIGAPAIAISTAFSIAFGRGWLGFLVVGSSAVAYLISSIPLGLSLADARMARWAVAFAGSQCGAFVGTVAVILLWTDDLGPVALGWGIGSIIGAFVANDRESLSALVRGPRAFTRRAQTTFSLRSSGASLLQTASGRADIMLLGALDGARAVGIYSVAVGASELVWFIGHSLATADYGVVGRSDDAGARRMTKRLGVSATVFAAAQSVPLALVAHSLMALVFGPEFRVSGDYLIVLLIGSVVGAPLFAITNYFTNQRGRPGMALVLAGIMLAVTAVACLILIPSFGAMGAAISSSVGYGAGLAYAIGAMRSSRGGQTPDDHYRCGAPSDS